MAEPQTFRQGYSTPTRWLHWLTALVVLSTIPVGGIMTADDLSRGVQNALYIYHKNIGILIILLVIARLVMRALTPAAPLPASMPAWQKNAAAVSHVMLYLLLIVMAVSGYVRVVAGGFPIESLNAVGMPFLVPRSDDLAETAQWIHATARFVLVGFILLHIGAALQHGLIKKDGVFSRIWPLKRPR
ncbi:cytochrome b [Yoonia sp.]|uniref:cytochrome b n=1 Tax=Yoonia sp. TaxID=2212373 RepID=UPI002FDAED02